MPFHKLIKYGNRKLFKINGYCHACTQGGLELFFSHLGEIEIKILTRHFRRNKLFLLRLFRQKNIFTYVMKSDNIILKVNFLC